jgi:cytochrome c oxidase assembly factor CtaG
MYRKGGVTGLAGNMRNECWCAGIAAYLFCENSPMAECISGLGAYRMLRPLVYIPLAPPLSVGADKQ